MLSKLREEIFENAHSIFRAADRMASDIRMIVDFIVVTTLESLVTEEMDGLESFILDTAQTESLVPACREDIE